MLMKARTHDDEVEALVAKHVGLALKLAARAALRLPSHCDRDQVESAALGGLWRAARTFEPGRGVAFTTYATNTIKWDIASELRDRGPISRAGGAHLKRHRLAVEAFTSARGQAPRAGEGCDDADLFDKRSLSYLVAARERLATASIDQACYVHGSRPMPLAMFVEDTRETTAAAELHLGELLTLVNKHLRPRDCELVRLYYVEGLTFRAIGKRLGVCEAWASQLHTNLLERLRQRLKVEDLVR